MVDDAQTELPVTSAQKDSGKGTFLNGAARLKTITLQWPIEFEGKTWTRISLKRLTAAEVSTFVSSLSDTANDGKVVWPIYCDEMGKAIPIGLLGELDDDDAMEIDQVVVDFLPRRFQVSSPQGSALVSGGPTAPSSAT